MSEVIDFKKGRLSLAVKRGFRNWMGRFKEEFGLTTKLSEISFQTLCALALAKDKAAFYLYDLIMNLKEMGSGFEFHELAPNQKMVVIDQYLFLLDQIRFECMKRLGWLESYPGESHTLVELIVQFETLGPSLTARAPTLSHEHPAYERYDEMNTFDQEAFIRKMIPKLLKTIQDSSTTL